MLEDKLQNYTVVSVPSTTTNKAADSLQQNLVLALGGPVLVITHNVSFMRVQKLSNTDAAKVYKRVEAGIEQRATIAEAVKGASVTDTNSDGGGSGVREGGDSSPAADGETVDSSGGTGGQDGEAQEKGPDKSASD